MKIPCTACSAMILPATAEANDDLCMPCKKGYRANIERAKVYYAEQRKPDPWRDYWHALIRRECETPSGFAGFTHEEKVYYSVCLLVGSVSGEGFYGHFWNSTGNYHQNAMDGLKELDAVYSAELLHSAANILFTDGNPPQDWATRQSAPPDWPENEEETSWCVQLKQIDSEFWKDPDDLDERLRQYALRHNLIPDLNAER